MTDTDTATKWTPVRRSVVAQVADTLRARLRQAEWPHHLPPERELCELFDVSRPTLRAALVLLQDEGLIEIRRPHRTRVILHGGPRPASGQKAIVRLLIPESLGGARRPQLFVIDELQRHLHESGVLVVVHSDRSLKAGRPERFLDDWRRQHPATLYLLVAQSARVQQWFQTKRLKAAILGSCHPGVELPNLDFDYRGICRHAGGEFLRLGHDRVMLLLPPSGWAGDHLSEEGFQEAFRTALHSEAELRVVHHDGSVQGVVAALNAQMRTLKPPTGILVSFPQHSVTVITQLARLGLRVPDDVSVIARDDDPILAHVVPSLARYVYSATQQARKVARMVLLAMEGHLLPRHTFIPADFQKGESLAAPAPASHRC